MKMLYDVMESFRDTKSFTIFEIQAPFVPSTLPFERFEDKERPAVLALAVAIKVSWKKGDRSTRLVVKK